MGDKIVINTTIDRELLEKFRTLAVTRHKRSRGALQVELEEAIKERIKKLEKNT